MLPIFFVFFETGGGGRAKPNKKLPTPFLLGHLEKDMKDKKDREDTSLLNFSTQDTLTTTLRPPVRGQVA